MRAHTERIRHDGAMPDEDVERGLGDVVGGFEARGLVARLSDVDYSTQVRSSPGGKEAPSRDHHFWVDLLAPDGRLIHGGYGSGGSPAEALARARQRFQQEQGG